MSLRIFLPFVVVLVASCGAVPKLMAPDPTLVNLTISAADNLNPDASGRASPLQIHIFELKQTGMFDTADHRQLTQTPEAALKADLVSVDRVILRPGKTVPREWEPAGDTQFVGITASYRDLDSAVWRLAFAIEPGKTTTHLINAAANGLTFGD